MSVPGSEVAQRVDAPAGGWSRATRQLAVALVLNVGFALAFFALGLAFASVFSRVQPMVFGETTLRPLAHPPALIPVFVHLALGLMLGLYIPPYLDAWYRQAASMLGN